jgi:hypothetical protein
MQDLSDVLYELRFQQNRLIAETVITHLEQFGISLPQFLQGLGAILDDEEHSQSAVLIQKAQLILQNTSIRR